MTGPEYFWSGLRGSNPRPQPWQGCALPTALSPRRKEVYYGNRRANASENFVASQGSSRPPPARTLTFARAPTTQICFHVLYALVDDMPRASDLARNPVRSCKSQSSRTRELIRARRREALVRGKPDAENSKRAPQRAPVKVWRRSPDSNRGSGLCRPVPYHLATSPYEKGRTYPAGNAWSGHGAGYGVRTRDLNLGKVARYQLR